MDGLGDGKVFGAGFYGVGFREDVWVGEVEGDEWWGEGEGGLRGVWMEKGWWKAGT